MFEVRLPEAALRAYRSAEVPLVRKLNRCFDNLARDPFSHPNIKRLSGGLRGLWRYRIGDWRVVYKPDSAARAVIVLAIKPRGQAYA